jgi:hypothetical protein
MAALDAATPKASGLNKSTVVLVSVSVISLEDLSHPKWSVFHRRFYLLVVKNLLIPLRA